MRYLVLLFTIILLCHQIKAQLVNWDWAVHAGGLGDDIGYSITCDNNNNIILVGHYNNIAQFGTISIVGTIYGGSFVTKMDSFANFSWVNRAIGTYTQYFHSVTTDNYNNIYVAGSFAETIYLDSLSFTSNGSADIVIAKYDTDGVLQWAKSAGGVGLDGGVSITCSDSLLFVGGEFKDSIYFDSTLLISNGCSDVFLACFDFDGNCQWVKRAGGIGWDVSRGITLDEESNIFLTGIYMNTAYFSDTSITSYGSSDAFIAKYDNNCQLQWIRTMNGASYVWGRSVIIGNNEIYVKGHFEGNAQFGPFNLNSNVESDYFICKLDMSGNFLWAKQIETRLYFMDDFWNHSLESDEQGNIYITGWFMDSLVYDDLVVQSNGGYDIFVMKIDTNGNLIWCLTAGNTPGDYSRSIARDNNGNLYITGRFYDTLFFGDSNVTSYGSADVFIAKIRENPVSVVYNEENTSLEITVYPNPASNFINIFSGKNTFQKATLMTVEGKQIKTSDISLNNRLDISGLASGIYILKLNNRKMNYIKRIIID
ncbi:MAG: T9SS type A sorting domain-containing protein [Bacteroidia bacterium]|nr:T9SS type A sorting domain-containing protein [Bacteroidia bacterium]